MMVIMMMMMILLMVMYHNDDHVYTSEHSHHWVWLVQQTHLYIRRQ